MTSCNDNIYDRTLYAMYSSDMQEAYSALVRGTNASAQCSEEGRKEGEQGQWQGKREVGV